jgi:3'-5' exoribonuclease
MKSPYVADLEPSQQIVAVFVVQAKEVRQKKTGEPYLSLQLTDKSGDLEAKMWDNVAEVMETFERGDFVKVKGVTQVYQNRLQLTIHKLIRIDERDVELADFFPASQRDPDEMLAELRAIVAGMKDADLKALLEAFLADEDIVRRFKKAPAAKTIHHAWLGGLIEHVLSLCALAKFMAGHYPDIDLDLLLAGVVLHDVGKIEELNYERVVSYSDEGQLLGHIFLGTQMLAEKLRGLPQFPIRKRVLVEHMILSHHGQMDFGSPKVPLFQEALLLHLLDNLDSKMVCMRTVGEKDKQMSGSWTAYNPALERVVLKKQKYLDDDAAAAGAALPQVPSPKALPVDASRSTRPAADRNSTLGEKLQKALGKD